jgi:hypothetical protein
MINLGGRASPIDDQATRTRSDSALSAGATMVKRGRLAGSWASP